MGASLGCEWDNWVNVKRKKWTYWYGIIFAWWRMYWMPLDCTEESLNFVRRYILARNWKVTVLNSFLRPKHCREGVLTIQPRIPEISVRCQMEQYFPENPFGKCGVPSQLSYVLLNFCLDIWEFCHSVLWQHYYAVWFCNYVVLRKQLCSE